MAVSLKHKFVSAKSDPADTSLVRASNWNDEHDLVIATSRLVGRTTSGTGVAEEIAVSSDLSLASGTLGVASSVVTLTGTQALSNKTITGTKETVHTISDGEAFEIDPRNGGVQIIVLGANRTPKATDFAAGESVTLMVDDGTAYTLTWTDTTFGSGGVVWVGGSAPTLATSGYTVLEFWKVGSQVYGAHVGDVA
jgi:hypothetical protein